MTTYVTRRTRALSDAWSVHTMGEERPSNLGIAADYIEFALATITKARTALRARKAWRLRLTQAPDTRELLRSLDRAEEFLVPYQDRMLRGVGLAEQLRPLCRRLASEVKDKLEDLDEVPSYDTIGRDLDRIVFRDMQPILNVAEVAARVARDRAVAAAAAERQAAKRALTMNGNLPDWEPPEPESASVASDVWSVASKADARSLHEEFGDLLAVVQRAQLRVDELFPTRFPFLAPSAVKDYRRALRDAEALFVKYRYRKMAAIFLSKDLIRIRQSLDTYLRNGLKRQDPRQNKPYDKLRQKVDDTVAEVKAVLMEAKVETLKRREISGRWPLL